MLFRKCFHLKLNTQLIQLYSRSCCNADQYHYQVLKSSRCCTVAFHKNFCSSSTLHSASEDRPPPPPSSPPTVQYVAKMLMSDRHTDSLKEKPESLSHLELEPETEKLYRGVVSRDRASLARAITLMESSNVSKRQQAQLLLTSILHYLKGEGVKYKGGQRSFRIGE